MDLPATPLHLVLVTPEIPANTGNIVRLCAVSGVRLHLVEPLGFTLDDRIAKRSGLDYWRFCQPEVHVTFGDVESRLGLDRNYHFLSARAEVSFYSRAVAEGDVLVLGCETTGLTDRFLDRGERRGNTCCLPMPGQGRCLNLSTTAGIVVYEALRRLGRLKNRR
jgi:tRNA (cytidine/uridine-2'-O-)-methyltransferase